MKSYVSIGIDKIAESVAEDESGNLMAQFMAEIMGQFTGARSEFGPWMQAAMNDAIHIERGDEWSDQFLSAIEKAALDLL